MPSSRKTISGVCAAILAGRTLAGAQSVELTDPVSLLEQRLEGGQTGLKYQAGSGGYLASLLKELGVNIDSQVLVFSKTSLQQERISPQNPRAIFFNDNVSVGFVPGGKILELASLDPVRGVVFHTLDVKESPQPRFSREVAECTKCHAAVSTFSPGLMVTSVFPTADGTPIFVDGTSLFNTTDQRTPFEQRWGGWYVTGTHGSQHHLGNAVAPNPLRPLDLEEEGTQNRTTLADKIDISRYLAPTSDLVALMTLEHQTRMTNLITSLNARVRRNGPSDPALTPAINELADYMLFADEALLHAPIEGVSTFTKTFPEKGPRDSKGRSLRDFDLHRRLFRYPVSYMIYSESFDALPEAVRERILQRIYNALTTKKAGDRRAALEILQETKPNLPEYWRAARQ